MTTTERALPRRDLAPDSRWRHPFNILQTNLQEIDAEMDVDAALDAVERAGADTWMLNAGGIVSFYPSEFDFQTRNPYLDRRPSGDLFGDAVAAAKQRGIKIIARLDMSKVSANIAQQHPEWLFRTADDEPQVYNDLYAVCPSGEYYQERLFDVVDEVLDRYGVDGVFFNWFNFNERSYDGVLFGACHCAACVRGFADFAEGAALPAGDMRSEAFVRWRGYTAHVLATLTARISDHVAARGEDIAAILRDNGPIVYVEANNAYRKMPGNDFWPHATGQAVSAHRSARPDAAVLVNAVAFLDFGFRMGAEQPEHFGEYVAQAIARGGNPSLFIFGEPGRLPMQEALVLGEEAMRLRQQHRALYDGMQSAAKVALVQPGFSSATARSSYWELLEEFRGVYESLLEGHVPFDVVPVDALVDVLDAERGARYELVVVPDIERLSAAADALDRFVDRGGRLLLTGGSGVDDDGRALLRTSPVERVESVLDGQDVWSTYVTTEEQPDADRFGYAGPLIPVTTRRYRCRWKTDAERVGHVLPPAPYAPPELAYGHVVSDDPAYARRDQGAGTVISVPWTVGASYRDFGKTSTRDHLIEVIDLLISRAIETDLPERVELIVSENGAEGIVHLIDHSGAGRRGYRRTSPTLPGSLRLIGRGSDDLRITALRAEQELETRVEGDDLIVAIPSFELFEVLRVVPRALTGKE